MRERESHYRIDGGIVLMIAHKLTVCVSISTSFVEVVLSTIVVR